MGDSFMDQATKIVKDVRYARIQRQRMNFVSVVQALFYPWLTFCIVMGVWSFHYHYAKPWLCYTLFTTICVVVAAVGYRCYFIVQAKAKPGLQMEPSWMIFTFLTMVIALIFGTMLGNMIFWSFMQRYYDYLELNEYWDVDVSRMKGQQTMDGGIINFVPAVSIDFRWAMNFKNLNTYCVAPLTMMNQTTNVKNQLNSYDFWVVGVNCCDGNSDVTTFKCGEYDNPLAKSGLRLLEDQDRQFFRLAVQQAEALYHIKAQHPLFLYWTEDPIGERNSWKQDGFAYFYIAMLAHFIWQGFVVALAAIGFARMVGT